MGTDLAEALRAAGVDPAAVVSTVDLTGGTYNSGRRLRLADGRRLVLKIAPSAPGLTYEHDLLATEAEYFRLTGGRAVVPEVVGAGPDFLLMTELPGESWYTRRAGLGAEDRRRLRRELGALVAGLHEVTGDGFGYPQDPPFPTWRAAFEAMTAAMLADAARYDVRLPRPAAEITHLVRRHAPLLDLVTKPVLVHFDLWEGNILLGDGPRITGIVDAERAFWGDPVAEFVSLTLFREVDSELLAGYGRKFDPPAWRRLALYRVYLGLIMLVELKPRQVGDPERAAFLEKYLADALDAVQRQL